MKNGLILQEVRRGRGGGRCGGPLKWGCDGRLVAEQETNQACTVLPLPATCVFLAFAFPFQTFPLPAADEWRHGGIAMFSFCKQVNNIVVTCPEILQWKIYPQ